MIRPSPVLNDNNASTNNNNVPVTPATQRLTNMADIRVNDSIGHDTLVSLPMNASFGSRDTTTTSVGNSNPGESFKFLTRAAFGLRGRSDNMNNPSYGPRGKTGVLSTNNELPRQNCGQPYITYVVPNESLIVIDDSTYDKTYPKVASMSIRPIALVVEMATSHFINRYPEKYKAPTTNQKTSTKPKTSAVRGCATSAGDTIGDRTPRTVNPLYNTTLYSCIPQDTFYDTNKDFAIWGNDTNTWGANVPWSYSNISPSNDVIEINLFFGNNGVPYYDNQQFLPESYFKNGIPSVNISRNFYRKIQPNFPGLKNQIIDMAKSNMLCDLINTSNFKCHWTTILPESFPSINIGDGFTWATSAPEQRSGEFDTSDTTGNEMARKLGPIFGPMKKFRSMGMVNAPRDSGGCSDLLNGVHADTTTTTSTTSDNTQLFNPFTSYTSTGGFINTNKAPFNGIDDRRNTHFPGQMPEALCGLANICRIDLTNLPTYNLNFIDLYMLNNDPNRNIFFTLSSHCYGGKMHGINHTCTGTLELEISYTFE